jgi:CO/xanthine dehydrogenase FAD-binding subunit
MHSNPASAQAQYQRPSSLQAALRFLQQGFLPIAGGTDYYPSKVGKPLADKLLDLSAIRDFSSSPSSSSSGLSSLRMYEAPDSIVLSGLMTWRQCQNDFEQAKLPVWTAALSQSAKDIGGWQVQNRGTLGGNLCNASPAADGVVALLALGAEVVLTSLSVEAPANLQSRAIPLTDFVLGNRQTAKLPLELLTQIRLPLHSARARSVFLKLGHRKYLVISIVMVAVLVDFDDLGVVTKCRIAIGSCAKAALRVVEFERLIVGLEKNNVMQAVEKNLSTVVAAVHPIDDVRGTATYRLVAAQELVRRAFSEVLR